MSVIIISSDSEQDSDDDKEETCGFEEARSKRKLDGGASTPAGCCGEVVPKKRKFCKLEKFLASLFEENCLP